MTQKRKQVDVDANSSSGLNLEFICFRAIRAAAAEGEDRIHLEFIEPPSSIIIEEASSWELSLEQHFNFYRVAYAICDDFYRGWDCREMA